MLPFAFARQESKRSQQKAAGDAFNGNPVISK
jgi:hypothetical protein